MLNANATDGTAGFVLSANAERRVEDRSAVRSVSAGVVEIGWTLAGSFDEQDLRAIREARRRLLASLAAQLPEFTWRIPVIRRLEAVQDVHVEPTELLDEAVAGRDRFRWDFSVVITAADLLSHYRADASFFLSRVLQSAVISTARLDPKAWDANSEDGERVHTMTQRLVCLIMHAIGHWNGLAHSPETQNAMREPGSLDEVGLCEFNAEQTAQLKANLRDIADHRLEEDSTTPQPLSFTCRALWLNRRDLTRAIWEAQPWQFPLRLNRLTAAAASAMLLMLMTAEVWDLGMNQTFPMMAALAGVVIAATTLYTLKRQRLLVDRSAYRLTEQIVLTNVATSCIVLAGMVTTFGCLFLGALILSATLFTASLASAWAVTVAEPIQAGHYVCLAGFISSLAIAVGALGASFEQHHYFRHVTFVDEEI